MNTLKRIRGCSRGLLAAALLMWVGCSGDDDTAPTDGGAATMDADGIDAGTVEMDASMADAGDTDAGTDGGCVATNELCNGLDDDCDGTADEGPDVFEPPLCPIAHTVSACIDAACVPVTCARDFGDCDGLPDNGCEQDVRRDRDHCGACGSACSADARCFVGRCTDRVGQVSGGVVHTCHRTADGRVFCWGGNTGGQLGDGTRNPSSVPVEIPALGTVVQLSAGGAHSCAVVADRSVHCWGTNTRGAIGDGTAVDRPTPTPSMVAGVRQVATGSGHTCAVTTSRELYCWGRNDHGQLGLGSAMNALTATLVTRAADTVQVALGEFHTCAVDGVGGSTCWGRNTHGQVGNGTTESQQRPVAVTGMTEAVQVAAGPEHSCALRADGRVLCWGRNAAGQLGDGTMVTRTTAALVAGLVDAVQITTARSHTCARRAGGRVVCWGSNDRGQLGRPLTETMRTVPAAVPALSDIVAFGTGDHHTCALSSDETLRCFGDNRLGQLGDGTTTSSASPITVPIP